MDLTSRRLFHVYAGVLGAVTAVVLHRTVNAAWQIATGDEPPALDDPHVSRRKAAVWALATGLGIAASQVAVQAFASRRFEAMVAEQRRKRDSAV